MTRTFLTLILLVGILGVFSMAGCGGKAGGSFIPPPPPPPEATSAPEWVDNPPLDDDEFLYAVESGSSRDIGRARRKAMQNARAALALKAEAAVTVMVKSFEEEVGEPADAEVTALFSQVSKSVADQTLRGSGNVKTHKETGELSNTVYVLMELPRENVNAEAVDAIKRENTLYNRFRASEGFKEMEHSVNELRERKKQQQAGGTTP
jgi:predicted small lipoprotein YifL